MKTALVVPCYNEAGRLPARAVLAFAAAHPDVRFVMVDDGSTDATRAALEGLARASAAFSVVALGKNRGKGEAVRRGMLAALEGGADFAGFWDADLATPLEDALRFRDHLAAAPDLQAVFAARVRLAGRAIERDALRHYAGRLFVTAADLLLRLPFYDTQCGAKLFRAGPCARALFAEPFVSRWVFDLEIALRLAAWGRGEGRPLEALVHELPLLAWRHHPDSRLTAAAGLRAFADLARIRLRYPRVDSSDGKR